MTNINELSADLADAYRAWAMGDDGAAVGDFLHDECVKCIHTRKMILASDAVAVGDDYVSDEHKIHYLDEYELAEMRADEWRDERD